MLNKMGYKKIDENDLQHILSVVSDKERVFFGEEINEDYSHDELGAVKKMPEIVVQVLSSKEVSEIMKYAYEHAIPVTPRGSGTGLVGAAVPIYGGIVIDMSKMNRIIELDEENLTLTVEPGVLLMEILKYVQEFDLFYPPDPGSMKVSTIGGNVAENSGGLRGLKYGVTRNYVMGMEVVLPTGELAWLGNKCVKDVAGYSLKDLFIGSEGTLGIITKVLLRLIPKPAVKKTMVATFAQMDHAAESISAIIAAQVIPCTLEFLDRTTIRCVEEFAHIGLPLDCEALLLMETDGHPAVVAEEAEKMEAICRKHGCKDIRVAKDDAEAAQLATARRSAFSALARLAPTTILEDATVPRSELAKMIRFIQAVAQKYNLKIGTFGHMGDGNLHPTFLTDERNKEQMHRVEQAFSEIFAETVRLGGTITGEHGIGISKKGILRQYAGDAQITMMSKVRRVLDPNQILNPGKVLD
jgi:glycolate oxidase